MLFSVPACYLPALLLRMPLPLPARHPLPGLRHDTGIIFCFAPALRKGLLLPSRYLPRNSRLSPLVRRLFQVPDLKEKNKKSAAHPRDCSTDSDLLYPAVHRFEYRSHRHQIRSDLPYVQLSSELVVAVVNLIHNLAKLMYVDERSDTAKYGTY